MICSIASQKGGTSKTSTTISLASGLALKGKKVLLVDIDPQANASKVLVPDYEKLKKEDTIYQSILNKKPLPLQKTSVKGLQIVPSHILLSEAEVRLTTALDHRESRLKDQLDLIASEYDYVFIDCPPTLSWLTLNALTASDKVLVTTCPGYFELDSLVQLGKTIEQVRENFNPDLELLGFLFAMSDPTVNSRTSLQILRQTYLSKVFNAVIPRNTDLRDAHFQKQTIFEFNPKAPSALAYQKLIKEAFNA